MQRVKLQPKLSTSFYIGLISLQLQKKSWLLLNSPRLLLLYFLSISLRPSLSLLHRKLYHALSGTSSHMHLHAYVLSVHITSQSLTSNVYVDISWRWFFK
jgi:hypothetical protein